LQALGDDVSGTVDEQEDALVQGQRSGLGTVHVRQTTIGRGGNVLGSHLAWLAPLVVPQLEACDVKLNGLLVLARVAERRGDALQHKLLFRDGLVARIAHLPVTGTAPYSGYTVVRQATVMKLSSDECTGGVVHGTLRRPAVQQARFTTVSAPEAPTRKAMVQARGAYHRIGRGAPYVSRLSSSQMAKHLTCI
jgi:hypothetical protein